MTFSLHDLPPAFWSAIQTEFPGMTAQGHLDAFGVVLQSGHHLLTVLLRDGERDTPDVRAALDAWSSALGLMRNSVTLARKLADMNGQGSSATAAFLQPPAVFNEQALYRSLLEGIAATTTDEELAEWWNNHRSQMRQVVSTKLKNELYDTIRARKIYLLERSSGWSVTPHE